MPMGGLRSHPSLPPSRGKGFLGRGEAALLTSNLDWLLPLGLLSRCTLCIGFKAFAHAYYFIYGIPEGLVELDNIGV